MLCYAKSLQSCPTLCDPIDGRPPGSPVPGILQARTLEWVAISFSNAGKWKVKVKSLSRVRLLACCSVAKSCLTFCVPMNCSTSGFSVLHYLPVYWSSRPLSQWCHPTISSSIIPLSSHPQSFPASESFPMSQFFPLSGQSIGASASASVLPMNRTDCFDLLAVQGTLKNLAPWKKSFDKHRQHIFKKQKLHFAVKGPYNQSYVFSGSHVWIYILTYKGDLKEENI